ncbi:hypothetical protein EPUS_05784 [Endocarpon pusillum Z07020]|uniref:Glycolipid transfer protein domain-containing protein n=1 Tax=Endocarpon pusillum (strain Z07020 / HMAS-L-300199) TaxID=1263415 RepID=U1I1S2_ENDPU|nr:uncharacterized protein EPUS_05784 [Endocarpon pusillum Z07020]ERF77215.1 hypothetical protein EPUS_05784 [Endocarpon pusillum Z07020]
MASTILIPPGGTWFDTHRKSFIDVPIDSGDQGIATTEFLEAAEATTTLFDLLGSVAFTPVKNDMLGNIKKIRERQLDSPEQCSTLQSLVKSELATKKHTATEGLLWLTRGLDFTAQALRADIACSGSQELSASFRSAYKSTLAPHHSFMVKPIFSAAMSATPYRKDFYAKMVAGGTDSKKLDDAKTVWLEALEQRVQILKTFMASKEAKW